MTADKMSNSRPSRRPSYLAVAVIAAAGISLSFAAFWALNLSQERKVRAELTLLAQDHVAAIEKEMTVSLRILESLVSFHRALLDVGREEFKKFVSGSLAQNKSIYAIEWIRRVSIKARTAYEESLKKEGFPHFSITEMSAEGLVPAGRRQEYFPVHYQEPFDPDRTPLGFNHASMTERWSVMEQARDEAALKITPRVTLHEIPSGSQDASGYVAYYPLFQNGAETHTSEARRQNLTGFIAGVFRVGDFIESSLATLSRRGIELFIYDPAAPAGSEPLYHRPPASASIESPADFERALKNQFRQEMKLNLLGREWRLLIVPTRDFLTSERNWFPAGTCLILLILTILLTAHFIAVERNAAELFEVNQNLEQEVALRKNAEKLLSQQAEKQSRINEELDRANATLKQLVSMDPLTGLLNRRGLQRALFDLMEKERRFHGGVHALLLDLDDFKMINDTFGYAVGDLVLKEVGWKIKESLRVSDPVARIGGDEFVVLLPGLREAEAVVVAQKIRFQIVQISIGLSTGNSVKVTASIGIVSLNRRVSPDELLENASFALRQSKLRGKNLVTVWDPQTSAVRTDHESMHSALCDLSAGNKFYAVVQPIYHLKDRRKIGYELLSRMDHPYFSRPLDFFQIALEAKILTLVDRACLRTCLEASRHLDHHLQIHLNLFPSTLIETSVSDLLSTFRHAEGQLHRAYCLEISEQQIIGNPHRIAEAVKVLKEAGVSISMDDVGFGSSCLESLILLEPDIVKLDKNCVQGIAQDSAKIRSLQRLVRVVKSCNAETFAEGIENENDLQVLLEHDIHYGQGYLFGQLELVPELKP